MFQCLTRVQHITDVTAALRRAPNSQEIQRVREREKYFNHHKTQLSLAREHRIERFVFQGINCDGV